MANLSVRAADLQPGDEIEQGTLVRRITDLVPLAMVTLGVSPTRDVVWRVEDAKHVPSLKWWDLDDIIPVGR